MDKRKNGKTNNSRLSLRPLKLEETVKAILQVQPESKKPNDTKTSKKVG